MTVSALFPDQEASLKVHRILTRQPYNVSLHARRSDSRTVTRSHLRILFAHEMNGPGNDEVSSKFKTLNPLAPLLLLFSPSIFITWHACSTRLGFQWKGLCGRELRQ